jgi:hypothetical protein
MLAVDGVGDGDHAAVEAIISGLVSADEQVGADAEAMRPQASLLEVTA